MGTPKRKVELLYKGPMKNAGRRVDIGFWQRQGPEAIFAAAWEMVGDAWEIKGRDPNELRLQRTVVHLQRRRS
jgi:hypothetical protein